MSKVTRVLAQPIATATAELPVPTAPGLWLVAWSGQGCNGADISATGVAFKLERARERCRSEWAERSALSLRPDLWRKGQPPAAAADEVRTVAAARATGEVLERYAAALWLAGERAAAAPSDLMTAAASQALKEWQRPFGLPIGLCDLSPPGLGAVCLAWTPCGEDVLFGVSAGEDRGAATRAAIRELTQMEFAHALDTLRGTNDCARLDLRTHLPLLTPSAPKVTGDGSTPSVECADQLRAAGVTLSQINLSGPNGRAVVAYPIELPKRYDGYSLWTE